MQIDVGLNENSFLQSVKRLREAIDSYNAALRELRDAFAAFEDSQEAIVPKVPYIPDEARS